MLKKLTFFLVFIPLLTCLTSCFQVIEEINLKSNGSGDVILTLNFSQSKTKLASIMLLDSINGHEVPNEQKIRKGLNEAVDYLKKSEGISNVKQTVDFKNYIATISFSFKEVSNINNLTQKILEKQKIKSTTLSTYYYDKSKSLFTRNYQYNETAKKQYQKLKPEDQNVFKTAVYTSIYRFENNVQNTSNKLVKVSASKKAVMLQTPVLDLINGKVNISTTIQLAK